MKKASMGGRSFNRVSQMPVLKKVRKRDTMVSLLFYFSRLLKKLDKGLLAPHIQYKVNSGGSPGFSL